MKKLLTLFVVLALAVPAFATPLPVTPSGTWFDVKIIPDGEMDPIDWDGMDVKFSDIIIIEWWTLPDNPISLGMANTLISFSNGGDYVWESPVDWVMPGGAQWQFPSGHPGVPPEHLPGSADHFFNNASMTSPVGLIIVWSFHVPEDKQPSDWIFVDPYGGSWNSIDAIPDDPQEIIAGIPFGLDNLPVVAFHVIPEPMTIALLGLGGLFLVRRKRK